MLTVPLAYKYVALVAMLAEINYCAGNLHLNRQLPIKGDDVTVEIINNPKEWIGFGGRIDTADFSFCFVKSSRLRFITKLDAPNRQSFGALRWEDSIVAFKERMTQITSTIDTNDAYRIATNWLVSMDVDLKKLEAEKPPHVEQQFIVVPGKGPVPLPLFSLRWGEKSQPAVDIMISGLNGELLNLRQEDDSYSRRPTSLVKDIDKLLAITDEEFLKYSPLERSNLVVRFSAVNYSIPNNLPHSETNAALVLPK